MKILRIAIITFGLFTLNGCNEDDLVSKQTKDVQIEIIDRASTNTEIVFHFKVKKALADVTYLLAKSTDGRSGKIEFNPDTSIVQQLKMDNLKPDTEYDIDFHVEFSNGNEKNIGFGVSSTKTFPTLSIPEITSLPNQFWPGVTDTINIQNIPNKYDHFIRDVKVGQFDARLNVSVTHNGIIDVLQVVDADIPAGNYPLSFTYGYHHILTDSIVNVVRPELSSIKKDFGDRIFSETFTIYGKNFHPDPRENQIYVNDHSILYKTSYTDSIVVRINGVDLDLEEPLNFSELTLKIGLVEMQLPFSGTLLPYPWDSKSDAPFEFIESDIFEIEGIAYLVGGEDDDGNRSDKLWAYNPNNDIYEAKTPFPGGPRSGGVAFAINGKGYYGLGSPDTLTYHKDWWEYDPQNDQWVQLKDFEGGGLFRAVGFVIENVGYVGTGISEGNEMKTVFWQYSAETDAWRTIPAAYPEGEQFASATVLNGKAYVGFGCDGSLNPNNNLYQYDPGSESWTYLTSDVNEPRASGFLYSRDNKIYYYGGFDENIYAEKTHTEYDLTTGEWRDRKGSWNSRYSFSGFSNSAHTIVFGGNGGYNTKGVEEYFQEYEIE